MHGTGAKLAHCFCDAQEAEGDSFLRLDLKLSLFDFGPEIVPFQLNDFAHFVKSGAQANSNPLLQRLLGWQPRSVANGPCFTNAILKICGDHCGQFSVVTRVKDVGEGVTNPLGGTFCS